MITTRTPFRISFVGGGSDLPAYYSKHGGAVLSCTIAKYVYVSSHDFFERDQIRLKYSDVETVREINEIRHPLLRAILTRLKTHSGVEITSIADVPAGTGMGSSSSFTVATLHNLMCRAGRQAQATKKWLAEQACAVELLDLNEPIGKQDQYAAAYGGFNIYRFNSDETVDISPVPLKDTEGWRSHLRLYYLGSQRSASAILAEQTRETQSIRKQEVLHDMVALVNPFSNALCCGDWTEAGKLMNENWKLKTVLASGITNAEIDAIYEKAMKSGAVGGKLLGAGGGGFMLFVAPPDAQVRLDEQLQTLRPVDFEWDVEGSCIILQANNLSRK